ncbi:isoleucine--tRNA ligase [Aquicella lusitana]|uniref:Isoleucine--tRNA ligase n=1 Tax=Aquicella lusitana TaxID=254246 RepID=A0A370GI14_9COXI|nr:isoleucine--tRNA ligase [Aquicella lusitana]RDI42819.1 isoleucyl-tRNA synthetase [Aquicella lusitana]VVC73062.1 Isoleucine--tRNA ligase [Aquicella lusitana]
MSDYKNTLNLPQTDFPMKANLAQREPELLKKWQDMAIYSTLRSKRKGQKKFILHLGPPYANGHIHLGTATTTLLKDIIVKSKSMSGFDAPLVPGWDCHGLPIELNVEKKVGKPGRKVSAAEFREACRDYAKSFINIQREEFKRLGIIADWEHPYLTMDFKYEANIIRSLAKIIRNDHVQKGYKPVHWCLDCGSALAEAEVEYAEKTSPSIDVRFAIADVEDFWARFDTLQKGMGPLSIPIWTTTPWTLPANQAVALNPLLNYTLVEMDGREQLLIAETLLPSVLQRYGVENHRTLGKITGEKLSGIKLKHPFYEREVPIVVGEHVTVESGTGAVHTAPAHGQDDYIVGQQNNLPLDNPVGDDGCFIASTPLFAGIHVSKVNDKVIDVLQSHGALLHQETIRHSYPHCWRHKTPLIFRSTPQWFISMDKNGLRDMAMQAIDRVEWVPDWGKARIRSMMENRPDWCISRQRTWGVPLTLFIHKETGELHPNTLDLMEKVALRVEDQGIEAWYAMDAKTLLGDDADHYQKSMDVLDVWFDSGVSHECVLRARPELAFPADLVLEGSDQHRGWFQSSLLTSLAINATESYKAVLTHGFVVDGQGRKMSKSLGNVIAPEEVIQTLGADILRLWVASIDYRYEISASKEILTRTSEAYRRIRNTARFFLSNLHGFDPEHHLLKPEEMLMLDRWAVDRARLMQEEILEAYNTFQFHLVVQKVHQFCVTDMGGFYLDIIKDRQYTMQANSRGRRSAQTAMYHIARAFVCWIAPILSFTAEEIWQYIPGKRSPSIMLETWYEDLAGLTDDELMNRTYWEKIRQVREAVNKEIENQRNAGKIGSALEAEVYLYCGPNLKPLLDALQDELRFVLITSFARVIPEHSGPVDAIMTDVAGLLLKIEATKQPKCERCWHRRSDVSANSAYPGLCGRCVENVAGAGEVREFA